MASVRELKKTIDYLAEAVLSDCYLSLFFHPEKKDEVINVMQDTVTLRNNLISRANNPIEKNNRKLVKKHYAQVRRDMMTGVDGLFDKLCAISK